VAQGPEGGPATGELPALAALPAPLGPPRAARGARRSALAALGARCSVPAVLRPQRALRSAMRRACASA
jgi:hypothetical protein